MVKDFVTLDFIPKGTDLAPITPVLARVFDRALAEGAATDINLQVRAQPPTPSAPALRAQV